MKLPIKLFLSLAVLLASCGREFLDLKRNANQVIPATLQDYQAILDYNYIMNQSASHMLGLIGSDEYYVVGEALESVLWPFQRNAYVWSQDDVFEGEESSDWNRAYQRILYANLALEARELSPAAVDKNLWNNIVGSALFFRSINHYQLVQLFAKPYDAATAAADPGIPIRLDYDVTLKGQRNSVAEVYIQLIGDLGEAIELLPQAAVNPFRPNKAAACALLARCYMQMHNYEAAERVTDLGLSYSNEILDYETLDFSSPYTFPADYGVSNPEILFFCTTDYIDILGEPRFNVDSVLYSTYGQQDLRRKAYFNRSEDRRILFKGAYSGQSSGILFTGLTTSELWLMRAECRARLGNVQGALDDLNGLLINRYGKSHFVALKAQGQSEALTLILSERRKELYLRGVRWEDLRRLNNDSNLAITLKRRVRGQEHKLPPGDNRWVWPIPQNEIELSGLAQNAR